MTERKNESVHEGLPLPSPRSPDALDKRILAHARENTPQQASRARSVLFRHPWVGGLATACVLVVAVFISEPERDVPTLSAVPDEPVIPAAAEQAVLSAGAVASPPAQQARRAKKEIRSFYNAEPEQSAEFLADDAYKAKADAVEAQPERADTNAARTVQDSVFRKQLQHCAKLLGSGQSEEAYAAYRQLRQDCTDCQLPDTLEQALEQYPPDY